MCMQNAYRSIDRQIVGRLVNLFDLISLVDNYSQSQNTRDAKNHLVLYRIRFLFHVHVQSSA